MHSFVFLVRAITNASMGCYASDWADTDGAVVLVPRGGCSFYEKVRSHKTLSVSLSSFSFYLSSLAVFSVSSPFPPPAQTLSEMRKRLRKKMYTEAHRWYMEICKHVQRDGGGLPHAETDIQSNRY